MDVVFLVSVIHSGCGAEHSYPDGRVTRAETCKPVHRPQVSGRLIVLIVFLRPIQQDPFPPSPRVQGSPPPFTRATLALSRVSRCWVARF